MFKMQQKWLAHLENLNIVKKVFQNIGSLISRLLAAFY